MLIEWAQTLITASAIFLGTTYVIGALIVNLNLTRRGIIEFQIIKVKYLAVGIVFLLHIIGTYTFSTVIVIAFGLLFFSEQLILMQIINLFSILSAVSLILIWARMPLSKYSFLTSWYFWLLASVMGAIYPMSILLRQVITFNTEITWIIFSIQGFLGIALTFFSQIYHYSAFYYGRPRPTGAIDPIGVGIPTQVKLACLPEGINILQNLGIRVDEKQISQDMYLLDETDHHYLLAFERIPRSRNDEKTIKIDKELIKAMLFISDRMGQTNKYQESKKAQKQTKLHPTKEEESNESGPSGSHPNRKK